VDVEENAVADAEVMVGKTVVYTVANGEFELTVGKRKACMVSAEGWKIVSGRRLRRGNQSRLLWSTKDV
jgi:hypothetical protein